MCWQAPGCASLIRPEGRETEITMKPTYDTHQRRAIEPDGTTHAARYADDRNHFTLACAIYPMPSIERLIHDGNVWTVTCSGCRTALAVVITCPLCKTPRRPGVRRADPQHRRLRGLRPLRQPRVRPPVGPGPGRARLVHRGGGSGRTVRGTIYDPRCCCCGTERLLTIGRRSPALGQESAGRGTAFLRFRTSQAGL
jgi:hypothetical protein